MWTPWWWPLKDPKYYVFSLTCLQVFSCQGLIDREAVQRSSPKRFRSNRSIVFRGIFSSVLCFFIVCVWYFLLKGFIIGEGALIRMFVVIFDTLVPVLDVILFMFNTNTNTNTLFLILIASRICRCFLVVIFIHDCNVIGENFCYLSTFHWFYDYVK